MKPELELLILQTTLLGAIAAMMAEHQPAGELKDKAWDACSSVLQRVNKMVDELKA